MGMTIFICLNFSFKVYKFLCNIKIFCRRLLKIHLEMEGVISKNGLYKLKFIVGGEFIHVFFFI